MPKSSDKVRKSDMITWNDTNFFSFMGIGEFNSSHTWIHPTRIIQSYELIFVVKGTIYLEEDGIPYCLGENQMILLEPGKKHGGCKESTGKTIFYWFHYQTDLPVPFKTYTGTEYYEIKQLLKKLLHIANTVSYASCAADAAALLIYEEMVQNSREISGSNPAFINKIVEYIRINIRNNPTAASVAQAFGYNPDYIGRLFGMRFNCSIKEYIISQKLNMAKDLLLTTDFSVKQISAELGYREENLFIKFFLYHEKISPTAFRNKFYNTHMNNK